MRDRNGKDIAVGQRAVVRDPKSIDFGHVGTVKELALGKVRVSDGPADLKWGWSTWVDAGEIEVVEEMPSDPLERVVRWVPVADRLPEDGIRVLWLGLERPEMAPFIDIASRWGRMVANDNWNRDLPIEEFTHWMPLPTPPGAVVDDAAGEGKD